MSIGTRGLGSYVSSGATTVIWAPYAEPLPTGAVRTWAEAVALVQAATSASTTIFIEADPYNDNVYIPAGDWVLNNTTIEGKSYGWNNSYNGNPSDFASIIPYYQTVYMDQEVEGGYAPVRISGCVGMKGIYFRGNYDFSANITTQNFTVPAYGDTVTVQVSGTDFIRVDDLITVGYQHYWRVVSFDSEANTLTLRNTGYTNYGEGDTVYAETGIWYNSAVFQNFSDGENGNDVTADGTFTLDTCDFYHNDDGYYDPYIDDPRYGNYQFGSLMVNGYMALRLKDTNIHWYSIFVADMWNSLGDRAYLAIQTQGACWIGYDTIFGFGGVEIYAQHGCYPRQNSGVGSFTVYQPYTLYLENNTGDWNGYTPYNVAHALDRIASHVGPVP